MTKWSAIVVSTRARAADLTLSAADQEALLDEVARWRSPRERNHVYAALAANPNLAKRSCTLLLERCEIAQRKAFGGLPSDVARALAGNGTVALWLLVDPTLAWLSWVATVRATFTFPNGQPMWPGVRERHDTAWRKLKNHLYP